MHKPQPVVVVALLLVTVEASLSCDVYISGPLPGMSPLFSTGGGDTLVVHGECFGEPRSISARYGPQGKQAGPCED